MVPSNLRLLSVWWRISDILGQPSAWLNRIHHPSRCPCIAFARTMVTWSPIRAHSPVFLVSAHPSFGLTDLLSTPPSSLLWLSVCLGTNETTPIEPMFCQVFRICPLRAPQTLSRRMAGMEERRALDQTV